LTDLSKRTTKLRFTTSDEFEKKEKGKYRRIVVEATPSCAIVKLSGLHQSYLISWSSIYSMAVKQAVAAERAERKARKTK